MVAFLEGWELVIVAAALLLLFGAARLPKLARSLGEARVELAKVRADAEDTLDDDARPGDAAVADAAVADAPSGRALAPPLPPPRLPG